VTTTLAYMVFIITLLQLALGQSFPLNLHAVDELGHLTTTLVLVSDNVKWTSKLPNMAYLLTPNSSNTVPLRFNASEKSSMEIRLRKVRDKRKIPILDLFSTLKNRVFFELELQECRPGFRYSPERKAVCECNKQPGILR